MPTGSITSNYGKLDSASAVLEVTATNPEYNQPALHIKQAGERGGAASIRSMTRIPISSLSRPGYHRVLIPAPGSTRLPFRRTRSRSMAGEPRLAPMRKASIPLSYFSRSGGQYRYRVQESQPV